MALRDRLQQEKVKVEEVKKQTDEEKFGAIRSRIADLGTRKQQLEAQRSGLNEGYGEVKKLRAQATKKRKPVADTVQQFKDVLAEKGIESTRDLVKDSEYQEEPEVAEYQTAKGAVTEQVTSLKEKKRAVKGSSLPEKSNITRKEADQLIFDEIAKIDKESQELFYQTPEGQEARRQEIKDKVAKRHDRSHRGAYYSLLDNNWGRNDLVDSEDIKDAKEYGEGEVKTALTEVWSDNVDAEIERQKKETGVDILSQDLEALQSADSRLSEAKDAIYKTERKRAELARHLVQLCESNPDNLKRINNYQGGWSQTAEKAVNTLVDHIDELEDYRNNFAWARDFINKYNHDQQKRQGLFGHSGRSGRGDNWQTTVPNPDYFIDVSKKAEEFYQQQIQESQERIVLPNEREKGKQETPVVKDPENWRQGEAFIYIHQRTEELLKRQNLSAASEDIRKRVAALEAVGSKVKEKVGVKLESDWAEREVNVYSNEHRDAYDISQQKEKIDRLKQQAEEGSRGLAGERVKLGDRLKERISVVGSKGRYSSGNESYINATDLDKEMQADRKTSEQLGQELTSLINQISAKMNEDKGLFGRKEKKIAEELRVLQEQKRVKEQEIAALNQQINQRSQRINEIHGLSKIMNAAELGNNYAGKEMTVGELMDDMVVKLQEVQQRQLTPEQQQVFAEYSRLKKKAEIAKKSYDDLNRSSRGY